MQTVQVAHVPDVMLPSELQTCAPEPARARVHRWCVMARGGATACVAVLRRGTVRGRGLLGGSAKARGPRVTCLRRCTCRKSRRNSRRCSRSRRCKLNVLPDEFDNNRSSRRSSNRSSPRKSRHSRRRTPHIRKHSYCSRFRCGQDGSGKVTRKRGGSTGGAQRRTSRRCNPKPAAADRVRRRLRP